MWITFRKITRGHHEWQRRSTTGSIICESTTMNKPTMSVSLVATVLESFVNICKAIV